MEQFMETKKIRYIIYFLIALLSALLFGYYCYKYGTLMKELPMQTWIDEFDLAVKYFDGNLKFTDLFTRYGEHGLFGYNLFFLINVTIFHMTTYFDVYLNDILVLSVYVVCVIFYIKQEKNGCFKNIIPLIAMAFFSFCIIQGSAGAMEVQVRLGMSLTPIYFLYVSHLYNKNEKMTIKEILLLFLFSLIVINVFGTLYNFAMLPFMMFPIIYAYIAKKQYKMHYWIPFVCLCFCCLIYLLEYRLIFFGTDISGTGGGVFSGVLKFFTDIKMTILSWFSYNAGGVLGYSVDLEHYGTHFLIVGAVIGALLFLSVILFFKKKMFERSWLPLLLIGESFFVFVFTRIGRVQSWQYYCNDWYIVHTKFQMLGIIWIFGTYFSKKEKNQVIYASLSLIMNGTLLWLTFLGTSLILTRMPHMENYYVEKQTYLFYDAEDMPVDEQGNTPLLHNLKKTNQMIQYMKKYNLSIYRYNHIGSTLNRAIYSGVYPEENNSHWIQLESFFVLRSESGKFSWEFYTPQLGQKIEIYVDGKLMDSFVVKENLQQKTYDWQNLDDIVRIKIVIDKEIEKANDDIRILGVLVTNLKFE